MNNKVSFSCMLCQKIQKQPVFIPCCFKSVCQEHVDECLKLNIKIECLKCHKSVDIPKQGFMSNTQISELIDSGAYLSEFEKCQMENLNKNVSKINGNFNDFENKYSDLKKAVSGHFLNIRRDIDIQHNMLMQQLLLQKEELLKSVTINEQYYTNVIETFKSKNVKFQSKNKIESIAEVFRSLNLNPDKIEELNKNHADILVRIREDLTKLKSYESDLFHYNFKANAFKFERKHLGDLGVGTIEHQLDRFNLQNFEDERKSWKLASYDLADEKKFEELTQFLGLDDKIFDHTLITKDIYNQMKENTQRIFKNGKMLKKVKENMRNILITNTYRLISYASTQAEEQVAKDFYLIPVFFKYNLHLFKEFNSEIGFLILCKNVRFIKFTE